MKSSSDLCNLSGTTVVENFIVEMCQSELFLFLHSSDIGSGIKNSTENKSNVVAQYTVTLYQALN